MNSYVLSFKDMKSNNLSEVGGKGLNLGELSKIEGIKVPDGFCVTTNAYKKAIEGNSEINVLLDKLSIVKAEEREAIIKLSESIRNIIEHITIDKGIEEEINRELLKHDDNQGYAIRSSATAEDLPHASFAGQQDTYLNIIGKKEILDHIIRCWASLFTDRAVTYRIQNGFDHRKVLLSVVVQKMILSEASGILFTADPMTSDRTTLSIDAGLGLGEAMVSGIVNPDIYKVRAGKIIEKTLGNQDFQIKPDLNGGIKEIKISERNQKGVLSDAQILELASIGKKIEAHFGAPQDIEWCQINNEFYIVQSRSITTLFPLPDVTDGKNPRVYMSIGHTQMMTDAIRPLGMSFFEMLSDSSMEKIGGRIYTDITHDLSSTVGKNRLVMATGKQDPLIQNALKNLTADKEFMASLPKGKRNIKGGIFTAASIKETFKIYKKNNPKIIEDLIKEFAKEIKDTRDQLEKQSEAEILEFIKNDRKKLYDMAYHPKMLGAIIAAILVNDSINKKVEKWLGIKNAADILTKSLDNNITTQMGLSLCDVADSIREYPEVYQYISGNPKDDTFLEDIVKLSGGVDVKRELMNFFDKFGMRCPGEIDITKERFLEKPTQLVPILLNNIRVLKREEHYENFTKGKEEALSKRNEIILAIKRLPGGRKKAKKMAENISLLRNFIGCREYPKYYIVCRYQLYKNALLRVADQLIHSQVIKEREDIFYLYFEELCEAVKTHKVNYEIIRKRKEEYIRFDKLTPPRIMTNDGFVPQIGFKDRQIPAGALCGIPVSTGIIEGRARVILSVEDANIEEGDILVTQFTDPSWTPLFVTIKGLVTEVGGFTTHGAVITREYGLPGVVGVENATRLIKDGQKIRVNGTEGYVEIIG